MITINLLPVRAKTTGVAAKPFLMGYFASIFLTLGVMAYLWTTNANEISALQGRLTVLQQEVNKYTKFEAALKDMTKKKELIDQKKNIIKELQKDRDAIVRMLALLSIEIPPEKMWFDKLNLSSNTITLDGVALSNEAIVEFMRNLESSPYIEKGSVSLTHSRQATVSKQKLREFQVTYRFFPYSQVQASLQKQPQ